jgi:hypothetical protein
MEVTMASEVVGSNPASPNKNSLAREDEKRLALNALVLVRRSHVLSGMAIAFIVGVLLGGYLVAYVLTQMVVR